MKGKRHDEMVGVQRKAQQELVKFKAFCASSLNRFTKQEGKPSFLFKLLENRLYQETPVLKAYFTRKAFDYLRQGYIDDDVNVIYSQVLPFALEALMAIQYYDNQILDRKGGVTTTEAINDNLILGNLLRENLLDYLDEVLSNEDFALVQRHIHLILKIVDTGQLTEKLNNLYPNYRDKDYNLQWGNKEISLLDSSAVEMANAIILEVVPALKGSNFLDWYLKRIFFSGAFIYPQTARMLMELHGDNKAEYAELLQFSSLYGLMMQIVNDVTDLVPTKDSKNSAVKQPNDAFSDLKSQNVTLPLLIHLETKKDGLVRKMMEEKQMELTANEEMNILKELFSTKCIEKTQDIGKCIADKTRAILPLSNPNTLLLNDMCNIANYNRHYKRLYEIEKDLGLD